LEGIVGEARADLLATAQAEESSNGHKENHARHLERRERGREGERLNGGIFCFEAL
jgi:hypothetical protein